MIQYNAGRSGAAVAVASWQAAFGLVGRVPPADKLDLRDISKKKLHATVAGGGIALPAETGVATNFLTEQLSWALGAVVVVLVIAGVALAVANSMLEHRIAEPAAARPDHSSDEPPTAPRRVNGARKLTPFRRLKTDPLRDLGLLGVAVRAGLGRRSDGGGRDGGRASMVGVLDGDGVVRRRLLRQSAGLLVVVLGEHLELPVLTWTVTPHVLLGHADVCEVDSGPGREQFTAWADALPASEGVDPAPVLDEWGVTRLRANRRVNGVPVVLTAAVYPF